jgi:protein required for attachment to host cells
VHAKLAAGSEEPETLTHLLKDKLIIVADLGLLKAYELGFTLERKPRLESLEEIVLEDAHLRVADKVTDAAGRHAAPAQKNWAATMSDDHNLKLESKRRLIRKIAAHIERLIRRKDYPCCWLAAHKEINHQILKELAPNIRGSIKKNLPLDLTKTAQKELLEQFLNAPA